MYNIALWKQVQNSRIKKSPFTGKRDRFWSKTIPHIFIFVFIKITAMLLFLILYLNGFKWTLTYLMNRDLSEVVKKSTCCCYRADCLWKVSIIFSNLNCGYKDSELYFSLPSAQPSKLGGLVMLRVLNFVDCMGEPKLIYSWLQIFRRFHPAGKELSCSGTAELRNVTVNVGRALFGGSGFWHLYFLVWYSQAASPICMIVIPTYYLLVGIKILT